MLELLLVRLVLPIFIVVSTSLAAWGALWGSTALGITVVQVVPPAISWVPDKGMTTVRVNQGMYDPGIPIDPAKVMWWIESTEGATIHSPIRYGDEIADTMTVRKAESLLEGQTYTVHIFRTDDSISGDGHLYEALESFTIETRKPPSNEAPPLPRSKGCGPGYWKQKHHHDSWYSYDPSHDYETVFGVDASFTLSLLETLEQDGGKEEALGRHAVAALLNANAPDFDYAFMEVDVIEMVQDAYASGDFNRVNIIRCGNW